MRILGLLFLVLSVSYVCHAEDSGKIKPIPTIASKLVATFRS